MAIKDKEILKKIYELPKGSIFKLAHVTYAVLGSSFDQKCYEPIENRHRTGNNNFFFCLDSELREIKYFKENAKFEVFYIHNC